MILVGLLILLLLISIFLAKELLKKFVFFKNFSEKSELMMHWTITPEESGMRNIVLHSHEPFSILVGFRLSIPLVGFEGFDYYGYVTSNEKNQAIISTYIHKDIPTEFQFMKNTLNKITITSTEDDQKMIPQVSYPPHWWQKWSFLHWER